VNNGTITAVQAAVAAAVLKSGWMTLWACQRVELAPQNENLFKIVTFCKFMVQCKSVTI
jgi:hypothetical protein